MAELHQSSYKGTVVVIDDEEEMGNILTRILNMEGYHITSFTNPVKALEYIGKYQPDVVLTDIRMPEMSGMEVLAKVKENFPDIAVIIMTAYATIEGAIKSMKDGAFHYVTKPFNTEELVANLEKALEMRRLQQETASFSEQIKRAYADISLVGDSVSMNKVKEILEKIATTDSSVLINGESGTGKELAAKFIHKASHRSDKRFVPIDCACIPENLLESELFGYERGAFTGAEKTKLGLIEMAHGGTLFLDEIGELPLALQAKLLRVLQEHQIQRVGGLKQIQVDIRLLAATNRDLADAIKDGFFRQDLFYRLNVIKIKMPPLREREGDIPILADYFIKKIGERLHKQNISISSAAMNLLKEYNWPGNVRELENVIERMLVLLEGKTIKAEDIPPDIRGGIRIETGTESGSGREVPIEYRKAREQFESEYIRELLEKTGGSVSQAARLSGISRRNLYDKMDKLHIQTDEFKNQGEK